MTELVVHEQTEYLPSQGHGYYRVRNPFFSDGQEIDVPILRFVGESWDDDLPVYRDRRCFIFEATMSWHHKNPKWYIGCDDMWHRKTWGDVEGPFDTPEQAWTYLKLVAEYE